MAEVPTESLLQQATARLRDAGVETARLDARLLLAEATDRDPSRILPGDRQPVSVREQLRFAEMLDRRAELEPVSRILGRREFFGRPFAVGPSVLDPRADSETLIEAALALDSRPDRILDLGTGSGCLLLTLLAEIPEAMGVGVDLAESTLDIARLNAGILGLATRAAFIQSNWFDFVEGRFDLIVSNPPYIPTRDIQTLMPDVRDHDPHVALDGGQDGLDDYRAIMAEAGDFLTRGGHLLVEIGEGQADAVESLAQDAGLDSEGRHADLSGRERVLTFTLPS